jgi:hypothetical protein
MGAIDGEFPLESKITLEPLLGMLGHDRHEECAVVDLVADLLIPRVTTAQLALIEKDLDTGRTQRLANLLSRLRILRGVAQKYHPARVGHGALITRWVREQIPLRGGRPFTGYLSSSQ